MFVQVVTYSLEGISEEGYLDVANGVAPRYAGLPGLLAKVWLENPRGNRYGAVYFWEDVESMERFGNSDLFEGDTAEFTDFISEEFRVLENLTAQTQPVLEILEARRTTPPVKKMPRGTASAAGAAPEPPVVKKRSPVKKALKVAQVAKAAKAAEVPATAKATKAAPKKAASTAGAKKAPIKKAPAKKAAVKKAPVKKAPVKAGKKAVR